MTMNSVTSEGDEKSMTIAQLCREAHETSVSKGWRDEDPKFVAFVSHVMNEDNALTGDQSALMVEDMRKLAGYSGRGKVPEQLMLIVSELSEALEEYRSGREDIYFQNCGKCRQASVNLREDEVHAISYGEHDHSGKPEGFAVEIADVLIRIGDLCGRYDVPIEKAVRLKLAFNKTRPHRHGGKAC